MAIAPWIRDELRRNHTRATKAAREAALTEPRACSAHFDHSRNLLIVQLTNGCEFAFPPDMARGLEGATPSMLAEVEVTPAGY